MPVSAINCTEFFDVRDNLIPEGRLKRNLPHWSSKPRVTCGRRRVTRYEVNRRDRQTDRRADRRPDDRLVYSVHYA